MVLSDKITMGFYGIEVKELLDDSMLIITKKPVKTGKFQYVKTAKFRVIDKGDFNYLDEVFGIYEEGSFVWTYNNICIKRLYLKGQLELIGDGKNDI